MGGYLNARRNAPAAPVVAVQRFPFGQDRPKRGGPSAQPTCIAKLGAVALMWLKLVESREAENQRLNGAAEAIGITAHADTHDVRYWHIADIPESPIHVRFWR